MAGAEGLEPTTLGLETDALPAELNPYNLLNKDFKLNLQVLENVNIK